MGLKGKLTNWVFNLLLAWDRFWDYPYPQAKRPGSPPRQSQPIKAKRSKVRLNSWRGYSPNNHSGTYRQQTPD